MRLLFPVWLLGSLLCGCTSLPDASPPTVDAVDWPRVLSPRSSVRVSASDDSGVSSVRLIALPSSRPAAEHTLALTRQFPYLLSPDTARVPNRAELEVLVEAEDTAGKRSRSSTQRLTVSDDTAPLLSYFAGFSYPASALNSQAGRARPGRDVLGLNPEAVRPPPGYREAHSRRSAPHEPQATQNRIYAVEWGWPRPDGVLGFYLYRSSEAVQGYVRLKGVQPSSKPGLQRQAEFLSDVGPQIPVYGLVSVLSGGGEGAYSNAMAARFLSEQRLADPPDGTAVIAGRPTLTWLSNPDPSVGGYLYFVHRQNPEVTLTPPVWSSAEGQSTAKLSTVYPAERDPLPPGSYFWRVAAVSFSEGLANGFAFSAVQRFEVR